MNASIKVGLIVLFQVISWTVFARVVLSWIITDRSNPIAKFLFEITEPILAPVRKLLETLGLGGQRIDFSPIVLMILLTFLASFVTGL